MRQRDARHVSIPTMTSAGPVSEFPGARVATLADAPEVCACGASWAFEDGGLACPLCGRRLYVATELRRAIERHGFGPQPSRHMALVASRRPSSPHRAAGRAGRGPSRRV